jgi:hypothetical protein
MGDMLKTMTFSGSIWFIDMQRALDAVAWAVHTTINPNIKHLPFHLAFNQDLIFCHAVATDWDSISEEHQNLVTTSNHRENQAQLNKAYSPGDNILNILDADKCCSQLKMNTPTRRPFRITKVNNNGTVDISHCNVVETINICCIKPYYN